MHRHPDRRLPLAGASNFRDLGGYPGHDGRPVRWRRLFRSDHLAALSAADRDALRSLSLTQSLDFRGVQERAAAVYELPGVVQHSLAIEPSVMHRLQALTSAGQRPSAAVASRFMVELYQAFVDEEAHRFAAFFDRLLHAEGPVVFHCTAGKDRTGFAAALALLSLGVSRDWVQRDYLLTNELLKPPVFVDDELAEARAVLWSVDASFLSASLAAIDAGQGGLDVYLERRMGLTEAARERLRQLYLQPQ